MPYDSPFQGWWLMDWLRIDCNLRHNPKVRKLGVLLKKDRAHSYLVDLWSWCVQFASDGDLTAFDELDIALAAGYEGDPHTFISALIKCRLIDSTENGLFIHDWHEKQGLLIERRQKDLARMKAYRERISTTDQTRNERVTNAQRRTYETNETRRDETNETKPSIQDSGDPIHTTTEQVSSCAVRSEADHPAPPPSPPVIVLPLNAGERAVTEADLERDTALYPAVDVLAEYRKMAGWLIANPTKRKTKSGVNKFMAAWLAKAQDGSHGKPGNGNGHGHGRDSPVHDPNCPWCRGTGIKINHLLSGDVEAPCTCRR